MPDISPSGAAGSGAASGAHAPPASLRDLFLLTKPGVSALVVFTAAVGLWLSPGLHPVLAVASVLAIGLGAAGAGALNMWFERDRDARMLRTSLRPLPSFRMASDSAFVFGATLSVLGFILLFFAAGPPAALLLAVSSLFYTVVYTAWLKPRTDQNIVIGGAAGALPPVIGWAAGGGSLLSPLPWMLFLLIFLWTPPHFWALALPRRSEYARADLPMLPTTRGPRAARLWILAYAAALVPASLAPGLWFSAHGRWVYGVPALGLGLLFAGCALSLARSADGSPAQARAAGRVFRVSIWHLFALFALLALARGVEVAAGV